MRDDWMGKTLPNLAGAGLRNDLYTRLGKLNSYKQKQKIQWWPVNKVLTSLDICSHCFHLAGKSDIFPLGKINF